MHKNKRIRNMWRRVEGGGGQKSAEVEVGLSGGSFNDICLMTNSRHTCSHKIETSKYAEIADMMIMIVRCC